MRESSSKNNASFVSGSEESGVVHGKRNMPQMGSKRSVGLDAAGFEGRGMACCRKVRRAADMRIFGCLLQQDRNHQPRESLGSCLRTLSICCEWAVSEDCYSPEGAQRGNARVRNHSHQPSRYELRSFAVIPRGWPLRSSKCTKALRPLVRGHTIKGNLEN